MITIRQKESLEFADIVDALKKRHPDDADTLKHLKSLYVKAQQRTSDIYRYYDKIYNICTHAMHEFTQYGD